LCMILNTRKRMFAVLSCFMVAGALSGCQANLGHRIETVAVTDGKNNTKDKLPLNTEERSVIRALAGDLSEGAFGDYKCSEQKPVAAEREIHRPRTKQRQGNILSIENVQPKPQLIHPGQTVYLDMIYTLDTPNQSKDVDVLETRSIKLNRELIGRSQVTSQRDAGTYKSTIPLHLPANAPKGEYLVQYTVEYGNAIDSRTVQFLVR